MENSLVSAVWKQQQGECYINKEKDNNHNKEKCQNIHKEETTTRRLETTAMKKYNGIKENIITKTTTSKRNITTTTIT